MPKDEFDFEDPLELNGVAFLTEEDTSAEMAECFTEEFMRMGYNHKQVLALFRNPHYTGPNMVFTNKGEAFVRDIIAATFARWGRPVAAVILPAVEGGILPPGSCPETSDALVSSSAAPPGETPGSTAGRMPATTPLGEPAPNLNP